MIGRLCIVDERKGQWVGRVVHVALSPRVVMPNTERSFPEVVPERWQLLVEDESGVLYAFEWDQITQLLPEGSTTPMGWTLRRDGGGA